MQRQIHQLISREFPRPIDLFRIESALIISVSRNCLPGADPSRPDPIDWPLLPSAGLIGC